MDTPSRLRLLSLGVSWLALVVGLVGALIFSYLAYSLHRAEADTAQLLRVQKIQTNLLTADATATNAFLVGGLEPASQRATYDRAMSRDRLADRRGSRGPAGGRNALSALNQQIVAYATAIEQARANNRQGFPVGAQYLRNASAQLRTSALPILDNLVAPTQRAPPTRWRSGVGCVFRRGRAARSRPRRSRPGLARPPFSARSTRDAGSASVLLLIAWWPHGRRRPAAQLGARDPTGSFAAVNTAADARIRGNNAKSNESLTLIARGSGSPFETPGSFCRLPSPTISAALSANRSSRAMAGLCRRAHPDPQARRRRAVGRGGRARPLARAKIPPTPSSTPSTRVSARYLRRRQPGATELSRGPTADSDHRSDPGSCSAGSERPCWRRGVSGAAAGVPMRLQWRRPLLALAAVAPAAL